MNSKLTATAPSGLTARVIPLAPLHDHAAMLELPSNVRELIGEGANYGVLETTHNTVSLKLGPASVTQDPAFHNGTKPNPDLRLLRALAVEAVSTAATGPGSWAGDPAFTRTFGYIADAGQPNATQTAAAALVRSWAPHEVFTVGDFTYNGESAGAAGLDADLAAFNAERVAGHLWPVMGNHDWDVANILTLLDTRFPHVAAFPATSYYDKLITDENAVPFVHLMFLDGGRKSDWTAIGAGLTGGAWPGSTQWQWMEDQVEANIEARWRIACIHWPMVTGVAGSTLMPEAVALARSGYFDLILVGHTHSNEELIVHGVPVLNISTASQDVRTVTDTLRGALGDVVTAWRDSTRHCVTRLHLTPHSLTWEIYDLAAQAGAAPIRTRSVAPRAAQPCGAFAVNLRDGVSGVSEVVKLHFDMRAGDSVLLKWPQGLPFTGNAANLQISGSVTAPTARHTLVRAIAIGF